MTKEKIGLFYGSSTCYTEIAGEKIREKIGSDRVDIYNVADDPLDKMEDYRLIICGIPTWDYGELQEDWEEVWDDIDDLDLNGKCIAIYGLGDQIGYPQWFQDAVGYLHAKLLGQGAHCVGYWPSDGYQFLESQALTQDKSQFVGLPLDEENEFDKTDARIKQWCEQILKEFDEFKE